VIHPRHRRLFAAFLSVLLLGVVVAPTFAWSNGPPSSANPDPFNGDGYGTHDWIIDQAVKVLDGRASWFDAQAARLRSDDPDTIERRLDPTREFEHVYRNAGKRGGAVDRVAQLYSDAIVKYQASDFEGASEDIGLLSHFYSDILQPYHSTVAGIGKDKYHYWYEGLVDQKTKRASDAPGWQSAARTVKSITNIRTEVIAAAAYSRQFFSDVQAAMVHDHTKLSSRASTVTGYVMKFGAKGLANIIWSISRGVGAAPAPATFKVTIRYPFVRQGYDFQTVYITAKDSHGHPIEGLEIDVDRPTPTGGTVHVRLSTDTKGMAHTHWDVGASPMMTRRDVTVSETTNGATITKHLSYMASPTLKSGLAGFKTGVSDRTVSVGQVVRVSSVAHDTKGRPVQGLKVTWTWHFGSKTVTTTGITDATGRATSSQTITSSTTKTKVTVNARTQSASIFRTSSASFQRT
jgi:hypothetical protein